MVEKATGAATRQNMRVWVSDENSCENDFQKFNRYAAGKGEKPQQRASSRQIEIPIPPLKQQRDIAQQIEDEYASP